MIIQGQSFHLLSDRKGNCKRLQCIFLTALVLTRVSFCFLSFSVLIYGPNNSLSLGPLITSIISPVLGPLNAFFELPTCEGSVFENIAKQFYHSSVKNCSSKNCERSNQLSQNRPSIYRDSKYSCTCYHFEAFCPICALSLTYLNIKTLISSLIYNVSLLISFQKQKFKPQMKTGLKFLFQVSKYAAKSPENNYKSQPYISLNGFCQDLAKMRRAHNIPSKSLNDHPIFLVDDDSQDSKPYCYACTQYEQDINLLQEKLMETHNKLIEQIDICREQEIKIIKLSTHQRERDDENDNNIGNRQKSGKIVKKFDKNDEEYLHSIEPLIEAKTELLRNNLEEMRAKVLSEIMKSNKIKQENRELSIRHDKQLHEYRDKIHKLEGSRNKLVDENQKLREEIITTRKVQNKAATKCICGFEQKYYELDKAFMNQRTVTNQLIQENNRLQNKIHSIYEGKIKGNYEKDNGPSENRSEIHTEPRRKKTQPMTRQKYKQEFEATKNLIKKLEEAEFQIRNKNNVKN